MKELYGRYADAINPQEKLDAFSYIPANMRNEIADKNTKCLSSQFFLLPCNSSAMVCSNYIVNTISKEKIRKGYNSFLPQSFYTKAVSFLFSQLDGFDNETLTIFLKQIAMILRHSSVLYCEGSYIKTSKTFFQSSPEAILFQAFWTYPNWADLFPSMPEAARALQTNKYILVENMLGYKDAFSIEQLCSDYILTTGFSSCTFLLLSSFIDFSFCSMLERFGILNYVKNSDKVEVEFALGGKNFISSLDE